MLFIAKFVSFHLPLTAKFKIYNGINLDIMIECTGGNYRNWMLCVDSTGHMLTTRVCSIPF